jgi:error-prone DNA polymerase
MDITMIGVDTAKAVFQVHAVDVDGKAVLKKKLRRTELIPFFEEKAACTVVLEACAAAHHWGRLLSALGHDVKLVPPEAAKPFVKKGKKNDAADAAALCEAAKRPETRFVPVKSLEQQGVLALHSVRALFVKQQTMLAAAIRGLASEFGLIAPQGLHRLKELKASIDEAADLPTTATAALQELYDQLGRLGNSIGTIEKRIENHARGNETSRRLATIPGVGPITASLIVATIADIEVFASARRFAAWLGLVPRQNSTGGKTRLGRITKSGNREIRKLLVLGATSMMYRAENWNSPTGSWIRAVMERRPFRLASVALANKMARVIWALMARKEIYRPSSGVSVAPAP